MGSKRDVHILLLLLAVSLAGCATIAEFSLKNNSEYQASRRAFFDIPEYPVAHQRDSARSFVLQLFHFNIEFVAGDQKSEDAIIQESFWPLVVMLLRHSNWGADIEMQGYMVEVMAERHPEVLRDFQKLLSRGKVKLISFHYADQLVVAFPRRDQGWSYWLNRLVLNKHHLPPSDTIFLQEDQFGEGILEFAKERGYKIAVTKYYSYFHKEEPDPPLLYEFKGLTLVPRKHLKRDGIKVLWAHSDDAEPLATGGGSPILSYVGVKPFYFQPQALLDYEKRLLKLEGDEYAIQSIEEYVDRLKHLGVIPRPIKPILDSVRGREFRNLFLWLGKNATPFEKDLEVRSFNYRTRKMVQAAGVLLEWSHYRFGPNENRLIQMYENAWKAQLRSEVSDATGTVPLLIEVRYSFKQGRIAQDLAEKIIDELKNRIGWKKMRIDPFSKTVEEYSITDENRPMPCDTPLKISVPSFSTASCTQTELNVWNIAIRFFNWNPLATIKISFPRLEEKVIYSPALLDHELRKYDLSLFDFERVYLGLPNGLIGLGNDWWVIKHNEVNHVSVLIDKNDPRITFTYQWPWSIGWQEWKFTIFHGEEKEALALAARINLAPIVIR